MNEVLIDGLAAARLVRLAQQDTVFDGARDRYLEACRVAGWRKPAELANCPWCLAVWVAAGAVTLRRIAPRGWAAVASALAVAELAGLVATRLEAE